MSLWDELAKHRSKLQFKTNQTSNPFNMIEEGDKLRQMISTCNYSDQTKYSVEKSVRQIINVFPGFRADILQFYDQAGQRRFIEMKGEVQIDNQNKIEICLMYPPTFPKNPPFLRALNPNVTQYAVKTAFEILKSKNDPKSLVLNILLNQVKLWQPSKSAVNLLIEANNLIRTNYPFQKIVQNAAYENIQNNWSNNPNYYNQLNNNRGNIFTNNNARNNNQIANYYSPQNQKNPQRLSIYSPNKMPGNGSMFDMIVKGQKLYGNSKKQMESFNFKFYKIIENIQMLDVTKNAIESQAMFLQSQNYKMANLIENSSEIANLSNLVAPKDQLSNSILNLLSSVKARSNTSYFLENQFSAGKVTFQDFMRLVRKNQQIKFQEKILLDRQVLKRLNQFS